MSDKPKRKKSAPKYWVEKNGSLYARLQYLDDSGKMRDKYRPIVDKRKARPVVEEMRRELHQHGEETLRADRVTFADLAEEYLKIEAVPPVYRNGTLVGGLKSYKTVRILVATAKDYFGKKPLRSIKPGDIDLFKKKRLKTPTIHGKERSIATIHRELAYLRAVLNFGVRQGYILWNPFTRTTGMISPNKENERDRVLSFDEELRLLSACKDKRKHLRAILICALDTGMRSGEIFKMRWRDISWEARQINIPHENTKTDSARSVGMTLRLYGELESIWFDSPKDGDSLVFGAKSAKTAFRSACKEAEVEGFVFHDCRHTATTRMVASGANHVEVMKITGHTRLKTFLRYLNINSETASKVSAGLNEYLDAKTVSIEIHELQ